MWPRLVINGLHTDTDKPPDIPIITGEPASKKRRKLEPKHFPLVSEVLLLLLQLEVILLYLVFLQLARPSCQHNTLIN